jgi:uroporphyrin-III C-methyltransferase
VSGKVYLVGAGPGDPDLLTRKAWRLLQAADVVLHDDLVPPGILALAPRHAQVFSVGKRCGRRHITQEDINFLMVSYAQSGLMVVRLKGGDPLVFSRLGEEIEALKKAEIDFEIVPGVTASSAAAAVFGIPLTDRQLASELVFLTGHRASDRPAGQGWRRLPPSATVVVYMPGANYDELAERLCQAGLDPGTPCLIVTSASQPGEGQHLTTIELLPRAPLGPAPSVLIVGAVAGLGRRPSEELQEETICAGPKNENLGQEPSQPWGRGWRSRSRGKAR